MIWLIMAAGQSVRFGRSDKLLAPFNGVPLIDYAIKTFSSNDLNGYLVIDSNNCALIKHCANKTIPIITVDEANRGLGYSIKYAINSLPAQSDIGITLADMPFISESVLRQLQHNIDTKTLISACTVNGTESHPPVAFSHSLRSQLLHIGDEQGAAALINKYRNSCLLVDCEKSQLVDIDTPSDALHYGN